MEGAHTFVLLFYFWAGSVPGCKAFAAVLSLRKASPTVLLPPLSLVLPPAHHPKVSCLPELCQPPGQHLLHLWLSWQQQMSHEIKQAGEEEEMRTAE